MNLSSEIGQIKEYSDTIFFEKTDQSIFVKSKIWGLTGDHYRIFFSDKDKVNPDEDKDVIFYQLEIFYKQQGIDSLSIYVPSNVRKEEENTQIGKIKISINSIVVGTQLDNYRQNYKKLGLCRVSVYDGID